MSVAMGNRKIEALGLGGLLTCFTRVRVDACWASMLVVRSTWTSEQTEGSRVFFFLFNEETGLTKTKTK